MERTIYISTQYLKEASQNKDALEALALAMCIKVAFVDSRMREASIRNLRSVLKVGATRLYRIIAYAENCSYISFDRDKEILCANEVKGSKNYVVRFSFKHRRNYITKQSHFIYSLGDMIDELRKCVLVNHVSKQAECADSIMRAGNLADVAEYKSAHRGKSTATCPRAPACATP